MPIRRLCKIPQLRKRFWSDDWYTAISRRLINCRRYDISKLNEGALLSIGWKNGINLSEHVYASLALRYLYSWFPFQYYDGCTQARKSYEQSVVICTHCRSCGARTTFNTDDRQVAPGPTSFISSCCSTEAEYWDNLFEGIKVNNCKTLQWISVKRLQFM